MIIASSYVQCFVLSHKLQKMLLQMEPWNLRIITILQLIYINLNGTHVINNNQNQKSNNADMKPPADRNVSTKNHQLLRCY